MPSVKLDIQRGADEKDRGILTARFVGHDQGRLDATAYAGIVWEDGLIPTIDEESPAFNRREGAWMDGLERAGWRDAFRHVRGSARAYTSYSPNGGNGFRIDQAFVNPDLLPRLTRASHAWGRERPSDHAALVIDLA